MLHKDHLPMPATVTATDASVVAVSERLKLTEVVTLDHRHFSVARPDHVGTFTLLP